jgi:hypothetical protein
MVSCKFLVSVLPYKDETSRLSDKDFLARVCSSPQPSPPSNGGATVFNFGVQSLDF